MYRMLMHGRAPGWLPQPPPPACPPPCTHPPPPTHPQMTVDAVKRKLCFHCGTPPSAQVLSLKDERGRLVAPLDDESRKLGYYSPRDGWTLHVVDTDPTSLSGACAG